MSQESQPTSNSSNLFPYLLSETETGFAFTTDRDASYRLDFSVDSDYLPDATFAEWVFSFSLLPVSGSFDRKDPRIEPTIVLALHLFFETNSKAVLLYICSTENNLERVRNRLFSQWFAKHQDNFKKYDFNYPDQHLYMSAIVRRDSLEQWDIEPIILQAFGENK